VRNLCLLLLSVIPHSNRVHMFRHPYGDSVTQSPYRKAGPRDPQGKETR